MNNKFMTELEVEQDKEIQLLKSQLAEQEVTIREFLKSKQNEPSACKALEAKILSYRTILLSQLSYFELEGLIDDFDGYFDIKVENSGKI